MKAIVDINGIQYLVSEGQEIVVNRLNLKDPLVFSRVLMVLSDTDYRVGTPYLEDVNVYAEKMADYKGPKVRVFKYKAKSRYRKTTGSRPFLTRLKITSIGNKSEDKTPPKTAPKTSRKRSEKKS